MSTPALPDPKSPSPHLRGPFALSAEAKAARRRGIWRAVALLLAVLVPAFLLVLWWALIGLLDVLRGRAG
jgi:hypothetical protein